MVIARTVDELQASLNALGLALPEDIGFVPTMGALHQGHAALMALARQRNALVVASIFVNPLQFNRPDDLAGYPRQEEEDFELLRNYGIDLVFAPTPDVVFPHDWIAPEYDLGGLELSLEGAFRPGHFKGVATVVGRLLDLIPCANLYMGLKDYQQCLVVERLIAQRRLSMGLPGPVLIKVPTVRDADGLALSSRNLLLGPNQLNQAKGIARTMAWMKLVWTELDIAEMVDRALERLVAEGLRNEYLYLALDGGLEPWVRGHGIPRALYAGWVDDIRLIDNDLLTT
jgi:pantoate--beta-alanine ligase